MVSGSVAHSATLPLTVYLPTTTTGYHMLQISQSHAPDDGQNIARNMLSWSYISINHCCI